VRRRSIGLLGAGALTALGVLAAGCGDDGPGDTARFCGEVQAHTSELVTAPATLDDVEQFLDLYRRIGAVAPLAIEPHWQALLLDYETASTVDPTDPESVQDAVTRAYATEKSAVAVRDFLVANCNVDLGPVTTIVPHGPVAPAASVPPTAPTG
jgi:hypothetical protein